MADDFDPKNNPIVKLINENKYDEAIALATKLLEAKRSANDIAEIYCSRGVAYRYKQEYDKSIADFTKAIELKPNFAAAYNNRGIVYSNKKDHSKAITDYTEAIRLNPNSATTYNNRGHSYSENMKYNEAMADYTEAIRLEPDLATAYGNRGVTYYLKGENIQSFNDFAKQLELDPSIQFAKKNFLFVAGEIFADRNYNSEVKLKDFLSKQKGNLPAELLKEILFEREEISKFAEYWAVCPGDWGIQGHFMKARNNIRRKLENVADKEQAKSAREALDAVLDSVRKLYLKLKVDPEDVKRKDGEGEICLYQYTQYSALSVMAENKTFWLTPACYQNDPEEGSFWFDFLGKVFARFSASPKNGLKIKQMCDSLYEGISTGAMNDIVFIRSLSPYEDNLLMWNSSYGDTGKGVSVGVPLVKLLAKTEVGSGCSRGIKPAVKESLGVGKAEAQKPDANTTSSNDFSGLDLEYVKCCRVLYLSPNVEVCLPPEPATELAPVIKDTVRMKSPQFEDVQAELVDIFMDLDALISAIDAAKVAFDEEDLLRIFLPIAHLVKNETYQHEKEFRLMFISDIFNDNVRKVIQSKEPFLRIETEKILFMDKKDPSERVFVGPLRDPVVRLKDQHRFEHEHRMRMPFRPSKAMFRDNAAPLAKDSLYDNVPSSPQKTPDAK